MKKASLILLVIALLAGPAFGAPEEPRVYLESGGSTVVWAVDGFDYGLATLTVTGPRKIDFSQNNERGEKPKFVAVDDEGRPVDGNYRWQLMVRSYLGPDLLETIAKARLTDDTQFVCDLEEEGILQSFRFSGTFTQVNGKVYLPKEGEEESSYNGGGQAPTKDFVILDDLIVDGSACIGFDCVNGESFGFDTLRLKENNLRIKFQDTSVAAAFPSNDWQLTANASANGGANKFSIDDITGSRTPFTIEANARSHSLYVDDGGRIGNRTSTPSTEIHTIDGDTPTLRLQQDGSSGFAPQTWDVAGNETNFFIRDVSNGSTLPFRIRPAAPTSSIFIDADGAVGFGTASPEGRFKVLDNAGTNSNMVFLENDGKITIVMKNTAVNDRWEFSNDGNFNVSLSGTGVNEMSLDEDGDMTIRGSLMALGGDGSLDPGDTFPDYVFEPDYELMSLQDLEAFVTQNRHLPNVPSKADISAAGAINMTELQLRMLEKVEELTLYTLSQERTIQAQDELIKSLTERLENLESAGN